MPEEMVPRRRGGKPAPPEWMKHHRFKDAFKTYKQFLKRRRDAVRREMGKKGATREEIRNRIEKLNLDNPNLDEFVGLFTAAGEKEYEDKGIEKTRVKQTTLDLGPKIIPWGVRHTFLMRSIRVPEKVSELRDRLKGMKIMKALRIVYKKFGAGENQIASRIPNGVQSLIEQQGIPEWPGETPEQIAVMVKTEQQYELRFVKATQYAGSESMYAEVNKPIPKRPRQIINRHIWAVPKAVTRNLRVRKGAYDMARVVMGADLNAVTHNHTPTEMYELTPV